MWDFWLAQDGPDHHLFYLQAPRSIRKQEARHWNVSIGHAVSSDLRHWTVLPDALRPSPSPAWDDCTTWTGNVLRHDGLWWMFYTGTSLREQGKVQRIGLATSTDLVRWERHGDRPLIAVDPTWYEELDLAVWHDQAWRDPWVMRDDNGLFHAFITARVRSGDPATRGVIARAESVDLLHWNVCPPVTEPGVFGHMEIPQVVKVGGSWRLIFSTPPAPPTVIAQRPWAATEGTYLLGSHDLRGPYRWSTQQLLDGDADGSRYGGRLVHSPDSSQWQLMVWLNRDKHGMFRGEIADPVDVQLGDGRLVAGPDD